MHRRHPQHIDIDVLTRRMPVSFCKRANNHRALLQKESSKDKASYASLPPCTYWQRCAALYWTALYWICMHIYTNICTHSYPHIYVYTYIWVHMWRVHVTYWSEIQPCIEMNIYICTYACIYNINHAYKDACIDIYIQMYIYIYICSIANMRTDLQINLHISKSKGRRWPHTTRLVTHRTHSLSILYIRTYTSIYTYT